ncbi:pilin [Acinetobacter sp. YH12071]|uniref:pilin n=1 Tax=Acinetobacter sp. YH12071 TaxID=2601067 RepID=UPI0015D2053F|nr:pilin [Acinetobacter sp. YH12071]
MYKIKGFTLIEILIVVAIIGILILFAWVQYNRHMTKTKMLEVIGSARIAQLAVAEAAISEKDLTAVTASNIGYQFSNNSHKYISNLIIEDHTGIITIKTNLPSAAGTLVFTPSLNSTTKQIEWSCSSSTINIRYLPLNCH